MPGFLQALIVVLPVLLAVAFMTIVERKVLAAMQRRVGPNVVGWYGLLQPFADALKLIVKELTVPQIATTSLFFLAPVISLVTSLLGWAVLPFGPGLTNSDLSLGLLYTIAISSLGVYGVLVAGWSANSKYAFMGSVRSTAQMVSYELVLSSCLFLVLLLAGSMQYSELVEAQQAVYYRFPLLPVRTVFFISALAETNRVPFDLVEGESELVAGFFTEHSSLVFVLFFLAEYASIVLMSALSAVLFRGGYHMGYRISRPRAGFVLGLKTGLFCFIFVWFRATLPRVRWDQLISYAWTGLLPIVVAFIARAIGRTVSTHY